MPTHPALAARLAALHQTDVHRRATTERRRRTAATFTSAARVRVPNRVPRHWRWRYG
jgi:hypothetical protein